jgi:eukaryotic translation initiation factor 2C
MSQCCLGKFVTRGAGPPYFANVAIKINAKVNLNYVSSRVVSQSLLNNMIMIYSIFLQLGGRNSEFANPQQSLPVVLREPTIIFGADVTHPAPLDDTAPSIASVRSSFLFTNRIYRL